jgi:hypothetical protein
VLTDKNQRSTDELKELINVTDRKINVGAKVRLRSQAIPPWIYRRQSSTEREFSENVGVSLPVTFHQCWTLIFPTFTTDSIQSQQLRRS